MQLAADLEYKVVEREMTRAEMYIADEVFLSGTAAEIRPCQDDRRKAHRDGKAGTITSELRRVLSEVTSGKRPEYLGWLDFVEEAPTNPSNRYLSNEQVHRPRWNKN